MTFLDAFIKDGEVERSETCGYEDWFLEGRDGVDSSFAKNASFLIVCCQNFHHKSVVRKVNLASSHSI